MVNSMLETIIARAFPTYRDVDGNLFVSSNTEGSHGVASCTKENCKQSACDCVDRLNRKESITLGVDRLAASQLLQNLGGTSKSITRLTNAAVDDQLVDLNLSHRVLQLLFCSLGHLCCTKGY